MLDYPYILAPQCPSFWVDKFLLNGQYYYGERDYTADLLALIQDALIRHQDIDPKRVYIVGGSMGGYQGLRLFSEAPALFAAALIACPAKLPSLEKLHRLWKGSHRGKSYRSTLCLFTSLRQPINIRTKFHF